MGRHDQRSYPKRVVCSNCTHGSCSDCVDVIRVALGLYERNGALCHCMKAMHGGEPVTRQVEDPETEAVYGPELHVEQDGTVIRD